MNKVDKKVKEYLERARKLACHFDYGNYKKIELYLHELSTIEIAKMIQREELDKKITKTERLLKWIGDETTCKGCGKKIYWILTKNNKKMPIDPDGEPHHATCSKVDMFRKKK